MNKELSLFQKMKNSLEKTFDAKLSVMASLGLTKKDKQADNKLIKIKLDDNDLKELDYHRSHHSQKVQRSRYL